MCRKTCAALGSEFVTYNVTGPPFTAARYRDSLRYLERRCDYMSKDDVDLILGGNLDAVFDGNGNRTGGDRADGHVLAKPI